MKSELTHLCAFDISCFLHLPSYSFFFLPNCTLPPFLLVSGSPLHSSCHLSVVWHQTWVHCWYGSYSALVTAPTSGVLLGFESFLIRWTRLKKQEFEVSEPCFSLPLTTCAAEVTQYKCFVSLISLSFALSFMHYVFFLIWRSLPCEYFLVLFCCWAWLETVRHNCFFAN